jgi:hypothetical protein
MEGAMKAYTVKVIKNNVEVFPYIAIDGEEVINGKLEKVIWLGNDNFIPVRNVESDSFEACNFFNIKAFDSDEFPLGTEIIIPEVTATSKRALILFKSKSYVESEKVTIIGEGIDDRDIRRCLLMIYPESEASVDGVKIQFINGKLMINGEVIE